MLNSFILISPFQAPEQETSLPGRRGFCIRPLAPVHLLHHYSMYSTIPPCCSPSLFWATGGCSEGIPICFPSLRLRPILPTWKKEFYMAQAFKTAIYFIRYYGLLSIKTYAKWGFLIFKITLNVLLFFLQQTDRTSPVQYLERYCHRICTLLSFL